MTLVPKGRLSARKNASFICSAASSGLKPGASLTITSNLILNSGLLAPTAYKLMLNGLNGGNPLGFMAALGVLAATTTQAQASRLVWRRQGEWRPLIISRFADLDGLLDHLDADRRACRGDAALMFEYDGRRDLKPAPSVFRALLVRLSSGASPANLRSVSWAAAFATDVAVDNNGRTKPTALHFTTGHQQFLGMARELMNEVTTEDLRELFGPRCRGRAKPR